MAEGQAISNDSRIVELLELLANNQMNAQAEQVKQMCDYVGTLEKQISSMTEELKSVRQELVSMKEDTISKHVKDSLKKAADAMQKQCASLKQQVTQLKEKICNKAGKVVDAAKRKGKRALYKITQVTGMRKKLDAIKNKVDQAIDRMENLEKAVGECQWQPERGSRNVAAGQKPYCRIVWWQNRSRSMGRNCLRSTRGSMEKIWFRQPGRR